MIEITNKIYYVGVNDRNKNLFEGLWPLPNGVSYNSYLIDDEKVCLIDTVEVDFFVPYLKNIQEVIGERPIDYLVINHMEPDHSGSIALIKKYYPDIQIIGNKKTVMSVLVTTYGLKRNEYASRFDRVVTMEDLFQK
jgi:flavorubredoxin